MQAADNVAVSVLNRAGRALNNAGYDIASGAVGLAALVSDGELQRQVASAVVNGVGEALADPLGTITSLGDATVSYWRGHGAADMAEDVLRYGSGTVATAGLGRAAGAAGSAAWQAAEAGVTSTARWVAPKLGEVLESQVVRMGGLRYAVEEMAFGGETAKGYSPDLSQEAVYRLMKVREGIYY